MFEIKFFSVVLFAPKLSFHSTIISNELYINDMVAKKYICSTE